MPRSESAGPEESARSFTASARAVLIAGIDYLHGRLDLARLEGKEAGRHLIGMLVLIGVGILFLFLAYAGVVAARVFLAAEAADWRWEFMVLAVAGAHFVVGVAIMLAVKFRARKTLFRDSIEELKRDQEWLRKKTDEPR